jgi:hypothetical protein
MPYIILRGRWFHVIVLNVHAATEHKTDDVKECSYEEFGHAFEKNVAFFDITPCDSCKNRRFGGT